LGWPFLISIPRPLVNLRAFWVGGMATAGAVALAVLVLLRDFGLSVVRGVASLEASSTVRHNQIAVGVLALLIAALILGSSARRGRGRRCPAAVRRLRRCSRAHRRCSRGCRPALRIRWNAEFLGSRLRPGSTIDPARLGRQADRGESQLNQPLPQI
jgi:hypothetical protein